MLLGATGSGFPSGQPLLNPVSLMAPPTLHVSASVANTGVAVVGETGFREFETNTKDDVSDLSAEDKHRLAVKRTKGGRYLADINREELMKYAHVPIEEAAKQLGIGLTSLKTRCRECGIQRWPFRNLKKLSKIIDSHPAQGLGAQANGSTSNSYSGTSNQDNGTGSYAIACEPASETPRQPQLTEQEQKICMEAVNILSRLQSQSTAVQPAADHSHMAPLMPANVQHQMPNAESSFQQMPATSLHPILQSSAGQPRTLVPAYPPAYSVPLPSLSNPHGVSQQQQFMLPRDMLLKLAGSGLDLSAHLSAYATNGAQLQQQQQAALASVQEAAVARAPQPMAYGMPTIPANNDMQQFLALVEKWKSGQSPLPTSVPPVMFPMAAAGAPPSAVAHSTTPPYPPAMPTSHHGSAPVYQNERSAPAANGHFAASVLQQLQMPASSASMVQTQGQVAAQRPIYTSNMIGLLAQLFDGGQNGGLQQQQVSSGMELAARQVSQQLNAAPPAASPPAASKLLADLQSLATNQDGHPASGPLGDAAGNGCVESQSVTASAGLEAMKLAMMLGISLP